MFFSWLANLASKTVNAVPEKAFLVDRSGFRYAVGEARTYFLVMGDLAMENPELRRAMAKPSPRESWLYANSSGLER
jgi:hypothetical protein